MTFEKEWKEWDAQCQEGRSLVPLERSRVHPGVSGLKCPCLQLEIGLPGPHYAWCHFLLSVSHLLSPSSHLSLAIGLTWQPCPVFCSC